MAISRSTLPSLAVIGTVLLLGTTGAAVGSVLVTDSDAPGVAVNEDVKDDVPRTEALGRDSQIKLRRTRERDTAGTK